jgi:anti-sigma factor RsiW
MKMPLNPDELHPLVDRLAASEKSRVIASLAESDQNAAETVADWSSQRSKIRSLYLEVLKEPISPSLLLAANRLEESKRILEKGWRHFGIAASVVLAFGIGWVSHNQMSESIGMSAMVAKSRVEHEFVRQAGLAHAVYLPEKRHPVDVAASEQDHLVQWLSKRLGKPLKVPQLSTLGYELVGGRLLPGDAGPRAQFMFQSRSGSRITLYLGEIDPKSRSLGRNETSFRYEAGGPAPSFYWADQGFGYALTGRVDRAQLLSLAELVYQQFEAIKKN